MSHSHFHAKSSQRKFGVPYELALPIHNWFDASKSHTASFRHRALRHHTQGIELCGQIFEDIKFTHNDPGYLSTQTVPIEQIGIQHLEEDFKDQVDASRWYELINPEPWMQKDLPCELITKVLTRKFGGEPSDYEFLYNFFWQFNAEDPRSKMILNHSLGIFTSEEVFGVTFKRVSDGKDIPTRTVAESIISTNFGKILTPLDWIASITEENWMYAKAIPLSQDANL